MHCRTTRRAALGFLADRRHLGRHVSGRQRFGGNGVTVLARGGPFRHRVGVARLGGLAPAATIVAKGLSALGGVLGSVLWGGYFTQTFGLQFTTASKAGFITALNVVFVAVMAAVSVPAATPLLTWLGVAVSTVGWRFDR